MIYVFPGNGTTAGMDQGITLKNNQKFFGAGIPHELATSSGPIEIPALAHTFPSITNTDNTVTLANNNEISGLTIFSALNSVFGDGITNTLITNNVIEAGDCGIALQDFTGEGTIDNNDIQGLVGFFTDNSLGNHHLTISNNTLFATQSGSFGIDYTIDGNSIGNVEVSNNDFSSSQLGVGIVSLDTSICNMMISNNTGNTPLGATAIGFINVDTNVDAILNLTLVENQMNNTNGIFIEAQGDSHVSINAVANQVTNSENGFFISSGNPTAPDLTVITTRLTQNTSSRVNPADPGYFLIDQTPSSTFFLQSPNLALSGVEAINTGSFSTFGTITFIPFQE